MVHLLFIPASDLAAYGASGIVAYIVTGAGVCPSDCIWMVL